MLKLSNNNKKIALYILVSCLIVGFILFYVSASNSGSEGYNKIYANNSAFNELHENEYYLPVIETTDIHGYILDVSANDTDKYEYRLSYIANIINKARQESDILLLDTGDFYQGNILSNKLNGQPIRAYIDAMGYDAVGLGNHEFDWNLDAVLDHDGTVGSYDLSDSICGDSNVPVLCWNLYDSKSGKKVDFTQDYVIIEKEAKSNRGQTKTVKIAVFGFIDDYLSSIAKDKTKNYEIHEDDFATIEDTARRLEKSKEADVSVVICHVSPDDMEQFVEEDSAIDLIVCGHDHKLKEGEFSNGVSYLDAGSMGQGYANADIVITDDNQVEVRNRSTVIINGNLEKLYEKDENIINFDDEVLSISHTALDMVSDEYPGIMSTLGYITADISKGHSKDAFDEDVATTWSARMYAEATGAQIGVINSTGVRGEILLRDNEKKHYVTGADIYTMFPFGNCIMVYELTYEQLFDLCSKTYLNSHSYLGISGVDAYYVDNDRDKLASLSFDGEIIYDHGWKSDKNKKVTVAVGDFVADFDNLCFKDLEPINDYKSAVDNESIINYLKDSYGPDKEIEVKK